MIDMTGKLAVGFFIAAAILLMPSAYAIPVDFWGNVTINFSGVYNVTPDGANITAHINGSDRVNVSVKAGIGVYFGATTTAAPGMFLISVPCLPGDNVSFRIYNVTTLINGTLSGYPCGTAPNSTNTNLNMTALQNGSFCSENKACITGVCAGDYDGSGAWCVPSGSCSHNGAIRGSGYAECTDSSTLKTCTSGSWVTTTCASCLGGICSSGGGRTPTPAPTPTPTTETNITNPATITEVISGLKPSDLGLTTMTASDVTVKQIGSTAETTTQTTATIADLALQMATDATAKAAIETIKSEVAAGNDVDVKVSLTVYKVESPSTGQSIYVSKIVLSFTAANDMKNVDIIQIIPKSLASSIANVTFLSGTPTVLQSDPIVKWSFAEVSSGQTKDMSYTVKKQLADTSSITTLAAAGNITTKVCTAGAKRCTGDKLEVCSSDGMSWTVSETCAYGCNTTTSACNTPPGINIWIVIGIVVIVIILALAYFFFIRK